MEKQRTLIIIKPDGVQRGLMGKIIQRFERVGLTVVGFKFISATKNQIEAHYPSSQTWLEKVGNRTLTNYQSSGLEAKKILNTDIPLEIGRLIKNWLIEYLQETPVLCVVLEGYESINIIRKHCGDTNPQKALPGTIRGDFCMDNIELANGKKRPLRNVIHASDNPEDAEKEIKVWFKKEELFDAQRCDEQIMFD